MTLYIRQINTPVLKEYAYTQELTLDLFNMLTAIKNPPNPILMEIKKNDDFLYIWQIDDDIYDVKPKIKQLLKDNY